MKHLVPHSSKLAEALITSAMVNLCDFVLCLVCVLFIAPIFPQDGIFVVTGLATVFYAGRAVVRFLNSLVPENWL